MVGRLGAKTINGTLTRRKDVLRAGGGISEGEGGRGGGRGRESGRGQGGGSGIGQFRTGGLLAERVVEEEGTETIQGPSTLE